MAGVLSLQLHLVIEFMADNEHLFCNFENIAGEGFTSLKVSGRLQILHHDVYRLLTIDCLSHLPSRHEAIRVRSRSSESLVNRMN